MAEHKDVWNGEYQGVKYEIVHWRMGWNYYLLIPVVQLPEDVKPVFNLKLKHNKVTPKFPYYNFASAPIVSGLDWHGGITLYEKQHDEKGMVIGYRLGCDYMHYWDEGKSYDLETVEYEAKKSIDKLWELVPNLMLRSSWNGEYFPKDKVYYTDKGVCVALEHKELWNKPI